MESFGCVAKLLVTTKRKTLWLKTTPKPYFYAPDHVLKHLSSLLGGRGGMKGKEKGDGKRQSLEQQV